MNIKSKAAMYLLGLIIMGIGFLCYFYEDPNWYYRGESPYPFQTIGIPLIFIGIAIMVTWIVVDALGWLDKT